MGEGNRKHALLAVLHSYHCTVHIIIHFLPLCLLGRKGGGRFLCREEKKKLTKNKRKRESGLSLLPLPPQEIALQSCLPPPSSPGLSRQEIHLSTPFFLPSLSFFLFRFLLLQSSTDANVECFFFSLFFLPSSLSTGEK